MKGGKPKEPGNKAALRLAEFNAARGISLNKDLQPVKNKPPKRKSSPVKTAKKKK